MNQELPDVEGGEGVWHQGGGQHWVAAGLGVTLAVLLPGRAGCPRALGERAMLGGKQKRGRKETMVER